MNRHRNILHIIPLLVLVVSCGSGDSYTPKPSGYMRIDLPEHKYSLIDTFQDKSCELYPVRFEASQYAEVSEKGAPHGQRWIDLKYREWDGVIFLTYKRLSKSSDLAAEVDTSYQLLSKHFRFASGVDEQQYVDETNRVYATTYSLQGQNVASTYQFWATDSVHNFLRGALYIDCVPNNDSLAPVLEYLQQDIVHLIETLKWR